MKDLYEIIAIDKVTGNITFMTLHPMSFHECEVMASKLTIYKRIKYEIAPSK